MFNCSSVKSFLPFFSVVSSTSSFSSSFFFNSVISSKNGKSKSVRNNGNNIKIPFPLNYGSIGANSTDICGKSYVNLCKDRFQRQPGSSTTAVINTAVRSLSSIGVDFLLNPTPEHNLLRQTLKKFAKDNDLDKQAREYDVSKRFNFDLFKKIAELGLLGVTIPEEDGGAGMDTTASVIVHHELSRHDPGFCLSYLTHSILFTNNFYYGASEALRKKYLASVLSHKGDFIGAMCMSEPECGTDVLAMKTTARRVIEGDKNSDFVLNGRKMWITNGPIADVFLVYAKFNGKITAFIVEKKGAKGLVIGKEIDKCGMRSSPTCPIFFDEVKVPAENLMGELEKGLKHMMRNLEIERLTLAAMSIGIAERCVELMIDYSKQRRSFGTEIINFGQIQKYIGDNFAATEAAKCLVYAVSKNIAPGVKNRIGSDCSKLFASAVGKNAADAAIQVMGGMGYCTDMPSERLWRDAKLLEIGGGTLEAHQKNLTRDLAAAH